MIAFLNMFSKMAISHLENNTNYTNFASNKDIVYEKENAYSASPVALTATMLSLSAVIIVSITGAVIYKRKIQNRRENIILAENNNFELQEF